MMWDGLRIVFIALVIGVPALGYMVETETGIYELTMPVPAAQNTKQEQSSSLAPTSTSPQATSTSMVPTQTMPPPTPFPSPVNGLIGFISFSNDLGYGVIGLNVASSDGSNIIPVIDTSSYSWSPDGDKIAYPCRSPNGSATVICKMNLDGSENTVLSDATGAEPAWSPDGNLILSVLVNQSGNGSLRVMNADGSNRYATEGTGYGISLGFGRPAWSPDSQMIAYTKHFATSPSEIHVHSLNLNKTINLTEHMRVGSGFAWSPDGEWIAFLSDHDPANGSFDVSKIRIDGTELTQLTDTIDVASKQSEESGVWWSPDGQSIAFHSGGDVYLIGPDGTDQIQLTTDGMAYGEMAWSPDSNLLAYLSRQADSTGDRGYWENQIRVVSRDGITDYNITSRFPNDSALLSNLQWQPGQR
jgi:dipeptidyl aminopeptidase/acylaminoacyl peptidase